MSQFGSIVNHVIGTSNLTGVPIPEVGMGATLYMWSDRHPYTIHKVSENKKTIFVTPDLAKRIDSNGMSESQEYEYSNQNQDKQENWQEYTLRKNRKYYKKGNTMKSFPLIPGKREKYYDFSF